MPDSAVDQPKRWRLGRRTITRRFVALVAVPLLFTGGFATWALATTSTEASGARTLRILVDTAAEAGVLADRLQQERAAATAVLAGDDPFAELETYINQAQATDAAVDAYRRSRARLRPAPAGIDGVLNRIDDQIARLPALRDEVREAPTVALSAVTFAYRITVADLVSLRDNVAQAEGGSAELVGRIRAAAALSQATEFAARLQLDVYQISTAGAVTTPADQQTTMAIQAGFSEAMSSFSDLATPQWQDWLAHALTGAGVLAAQRLQDEIAHAPVGAALTVDRTLWMNAMSTEIAQLHDVERRIDAAVVAEVGQLYNGKTRWLTAEAIVALLAIVAAGVMAVAQSRSMIRRLRGLSASALATAYISLPNTVAALRSIGTRTVDPEEFADSAEAPPPDSGHDEIADVSNAFLAVHRQAILTAADLANTRVGLSQILLHLARRNQRLVGVLMRELDGAERDEADPERLATLFRLDQLATRMGRYTDNLLVVGGQPATRIASGDVGLDVVLRGAQSKIERYQQVRINAVGHPMVVRGDAVHDLMNLLAELLDNATQFSPPEAPVDVACGYVGNTVMVRVADHGVGIPPARLEQVNSTLAAPPSIDVSAVRSMGLTVVAHIASYHRIAVRLYAAQRGGTIADISLPAQLCWLRSGGGPDPITDVIPRPRPAMDGVGARAAIPAESEFAGFFATSPRRSAPASGAGWQGPADAGWRAAASAATPHAPRHTGVGLPVRNPMAHLVPGGGGAGGAVDQRDPARVAQSVAAFARGNAHSRSLHPGADPQPHR